MNFAEFWQANQGLVTNTGYDTWSVRYTGTLDDFEAYRTQIESGLRRHAERRKTRLVAVTAVADGDSFIVYGIGAR